MSTHSLPNRQSRPDSGAQRQAKYAQSGRQIACVIRDPDALAKLALLEVKCGGITAAVTSALRKSKC